MDSELQNNQEFSIPNSNSTYSPQKIKVIGVGGGGNNAINHMYNLGVRNVSFIVANTDRQALENSPVPTKVLLGPNVTKGRGAGNVPERAREAAEESANEINDLFDDDTDMVFITAGMGGGTGTGASPVIARVAKERGLLTIGIVTIPFLFEGPRKIMKALEGAKEMGKYVDALLVINNERLSEIYRDYDFLNAFGKADDILSMAAISISEIVTCDGYINLDFNDVDNTLRDGHTAIISTGYGEGEYRVSKAIEDALNSPLLRNTDIYGSKKLLFNLYFSREAEDKFKIDETNQITEFISNIHSDVDVIWGVAFDDSLGNQVKFTILAAGFDSTLNSDDDSTAPTHHQSFRPSHNTISANVQSSSKEKTVQPSTPEREKRENKALEDIYGPDKLREFQRTKDESRFIVLKPNQFDDDTAIEAINDKPALNRDRQSISAVRGSASTSSQQHNEKRGPKSINFDDLN